MSIEIDNQSSVSSTFEGFKKLEPMVYAFTKAINETTPENELAFLKFYDEYDIDDIAKETGNVGFCAFANYTLLFKYVGFCGFLWIRVLLTVKTPVIDKCE